MNPIHFVVRWYPRPELRGQFLEALGRLGPALTPDITQAIEFVRPTFNREGHFIVMEVWKDREVLDRLRASDLFHGVIRDLSACCSRPLEIEHLNPLDGDGSCFERYARGKADPRLYPDLGAMTPLFL